MISRAVAGIGAIVIEDGRGSVIIASVTVDGFLGLVGAGRGGTYSVSLKELAKSKEERCSDNKKSVPVDWPRSGTIGCKRRAISPEYIHQGVEAAAARCWQGIEAPAVREHVCYTYPTYLEHVTYHTDVSHTHITHTVYCACHISHGGLECLLSSTNDAGLAIDQCDRARKHV